MGVVARTGGGTELGGVFLVVLVEGGPWGWILPEVVRIEAGAHAGDHARGHAGAGAGGEG